jgi:putative intracellular protease/amidase
MKKLLLAVLSYALVVTPASSQPAIKGKVLVIVSSTDAIALQGGKRYKTGYFLNELAVPVKRLKEQGYSITFANPKGNKPTMDIHSDSVDFFNKNYSEYQKVKAFHDNLVELKSPRKLADVVHNGLAQYDAVFFPGGHAPMQDLISDPSVRQVLLHFHQTGKPTALICHAPISLIAAMPQADAFVRAMKQGNPKKAAELTKNWQYQGYKMTIFSTAEEQIAESGQLQGKMLFYPQAALTTAGGDVRVAKSWSSQVVKDRELITGQNPFSDNALAETLVKAITSGRHVNEKKKATKNERTYRH